eukprot:scaffold225765_cov53-Cyclotella_meneghiniana.AAC.1
MIITNSPILYHSRASGAERRCRHGENSQKMAFGRRREAAVARLRGLFGPNPARRRWPISWP